MPHAIIEYSENIASEFKSRDALGIVHLAMIDSGLFQSHDIKTRAHPADAYLVGDKDAGGSFLHVRVYLMEGRTTEQKQNLSQSVFNALSAKLTSIDSITVDIREIDKATYRKSAA